MREVVNLAGTEAIDHIRKRSEMYVNLQDPYLANALLRESFCFARDAARAGRCQSLVVELFGEGHARVSDDGPGLPIDRDSSGESLAMRYFTQLGACRKAKSRGESYCVHGLAVLNALSAEIQLRSVVAGMEWSMSFQSGRPDQSFRNLGPSAGRGSVMDIALDPTLIENREFDLVEMANWMRACAEGLSFQLWDRRTGALENIIIEKSNCSIASE